jgi:hypothetical protein
MITLQYFPEYKVYICQNLLSRLNIDLDEYDVFVHVSRGFIRGITHIKFAAYHYLETLRYKDRWIRDPNYRFLAFLLMEDQVNKIRKTIENEKKDTTIIITKGKLMCKEVIFREGDDYILGQLAIFRLKVEKERLLK